MRHHFEQRVGNGLTLDVHTDRMRLHDGRLAVHVDDKTGQAVALAVDKAVNVVVATPHEAQRLAQAERLGQTLCPKRGIDCHIFEREHPYGNRADLVVSDGEENARLVEHPHGVAFDDARICPGYGAREYPRMKALQAVGFSAPEGDCLIGHRICFHQGRDCNFRSL